LKSTGQASIEDKGRLARIILEGLAVKYSEVLDKLQYLIGRRIEVLHIVGGGCQNEILNQFTSDATGKKVVAGPVEATVLGNILVQAMATGEINSISQGRKIVSQSFQFKEYFPENTDEWYRYIKNSKFG
jgi:rhamnulokinase